MDVLEVLEKVGPRLRGLSIPQLLQICEHLEVEPGDAAERADGHQRLVRKVMNQLNSDAVQDSEDGGLALLQDLNGFIDELIGPAITPDKATTPAPSANPDSSETPQESGPAPVTASPAKFQKASLPPEVLSVIRREFKISRS